MSTTPVRAELPIGSLPGAPTPTIQVPANLDHHDQIEPSSLLAPTSQPPVKADVCISDLESRINQIIDNPTFASARWGVMVESLYNSTLLYQRGADRLLIPASNVKLLTTATALFALTRSTPEDRSALSWWLTVANRDSDNDYSDRLLARIGGIQTVRNVMSNLGVANEDFRQVDGSGLSRQNAAKPRALTGLLKSIYGVDDEGLFYNSLAIAGVSGTLRNRFQGTPLVGRVHAKTGTLTGVRALSGYLEHSTEGVIAFSIIVNQSGQDGTVMVQAIDQIVLQLNQFTGCK